MQTITKHYIDGALSRDLEVRIGDPNPGIDT